MQEASSLHDKYHADSSFKAEMDQHNEKYQLLVQEAQYTNLSEINEDILLRLDRSHDVIYFYCAMYHQIKR